MVGKESMLLAEETYTPTKMFPSDEKYGLTYQIKRTVVCTPSNIAEGSARKGNKEFIQFLYIAVGSLFELKTQLILRHSL